MALTAKASSGDFKPVPPGIHQAILFRIIDLGTQLNKQFDVYQHKISIFWEVPGFRLETESGEKAGIVQARYTLSLHERAALRKMLEQWRGKRFSVEETAQGVDLEALLGKPCQLNIVHHEGNDGRIYANVDSVLPWPPGVEPPTSTENDQFAFSLEDWKNWEKLSENMQKIVNESVEAQRKQKENKEPVTTQERSDFDDDIPF